MIALPWLETARTLSRLPETSDAPGLLAYRINNREHFAPWEPQRDGCYYTLQHCLQTIAEGTHAASINRSYALLVLAPQRQNEIVASFTFSNVVRGPFQACLLGFGTDARLQGQGLLREALDAGLGWAFGELALHRVMANYLPHNERSARLLGRLGFEREGYARKYLQIDGRWQDHVLTAKISGDG